MPVIELRQYTLHPGQRDVLIALFEAEFLESQEAVGMRIVGQFRDADRPDRFVWLREFKDFAERPGQLNTFYSGAVWQAHRAQANATIVDSDNVLLLCPVHPDADFPAASRPRPPRGTTAAASTLVMATIYSFANTVDPGFVAFFDEVMAPQLRAAGIPVLAALVTETRANNYPRLPVRDQDHVFVWFTQFASAADADRRLAGLAASSSWRGVTDRLRHTLATDPEVLRLEPTPRSQLRD